MSENRYAEWTNKEYLDFIEDLMKKALEFYNDDQALESAGMCALTLNNIIYYLRRLRKCE